MNYQIPSSQANYYKAISPEQLNQVIEAIVDGRYSWACVLILRFVGYNPLHFIPQRTYSRLIKENSQVPPPSGANHQVQTTMNSTLSNPGRQASKVLGNNKLDYLETLDKKQRDRQDQDSNRPLYSDTKITELSSFRLHKLHNHN
ncbi:heterocyst formation protein HetP-like protein [Komarekiella sp. 'clone 1']|uniref:Heterocyst formation protein HetP-like protein n=1 Tax=Komarekiella delphini-convector SJRDD-AB1 TaxID=2593771 RepID=A0AA40SWP4_9NOST|nr:HetP family heterocyst commitment protein [Komarekiella delphini-convector]MBD6616393.1 heterocyst formation protein HetP-like protein [Komarekiella delphini-convector SJRDD-AB1]